MRTQAVPTDSCLPWRDTEIDPILPSTFSTTLDARLAGALDAVGVAGWINTLRSTKADAQSTGVTAKYSDLLHASHDRCTVAWVPVHVVMLCLDSACSISRLPGTSINAVQPFS